MVTLTPEMRAFMVQAKKLYDYRSWSDLLRTLITEGLETRRVIDAGARKNKKAMLCEGDLGKHSGAF